MQRSRIILIHGNGGCKPTDYWFPFVKSELEDKGFQVLTPQFPDPELARSSIWLPFLENELHADEKTVLVGHSSGAVAAMRFAEEHRLLGSVLVGGYQSDLGFEQEKAWDWDAIKANQKWILQFASTDDPWIPIHEPRLIHEKLDSDYHEYKDQGHFGGDYDKKEFPELISALESLLSTD